jgi:hypothetical protein
MPEVYRRLALATRAAAVAGAAMLAFATLTSCGGDGVGGADKAADSPRTRAQVADVRPTKPPHHARHTSPHPPSTSDDDDSPPPNPAGAELGESLRFGGLEVRALDYRKAGYQGAATGTRVDILSVEECAEAGSANVQHQTWRLVDSGGRTLGVAGGKIVNGHPTEDLPQTLAAGQCITTLLAIGVPAGSMPVAVQDGPDDTWLLTD